MGVSLELEVHGLFPGSISLPFCNLPIHLMNRLLGITLKSQKWSNRLNTPVRPFHLLLVEEGMPESLFGADPRVWVGVEHFL